jgi:undecaprenyl-diphosphatase
MPKAFIATVRANLLRFEERELALVRRQVIWGTRAWLRPFALSLNWLSNGWLYGVIVAGLLWFHPPRAFFTIVAAALAVGGAHAIYRWMKPAAARPRPCDIDPSLKPMLKTMDKYSFPSGHCMTLTCVLIPITAAVPKLAGLAALLWLLIAWARLATAHHYPTDLIAGTILGALVSWPITTLII